MKKYFIRHKLKAGDITHLSDADAERISKLHEIEENDLIELTTLEASFLGKVVYKETASVEVEVLEKLDKPHESITNESGLTIIQAISGDIKFNFFLEKAVELGVIQIIPVVAGYSKIDLKTSKKTYLKWVNIIKDAGEQSRNRTLPFLHDPVLLKDLNTLQLISENKICLATENITASSLQSVLKQSPDKLIVAVGPERGWSSADIKAFEDLDFKFVKLKGYILRTETAGLVIASIFQFINGKL